MNKALCLSGSFVWGEGEANEDALLRPQGRAESKKQKQGEPAALLMAEWISAALSLGHTNGLKQSQNERRKTLSGSWVWWLMRVTQHLEAEAEGLSRVQSHPGPHSELQASPTRVAFTQPKSRWRNTVK